MIWTTAALTADLQARMEADRWLCAREATVAEPTFGTAAEDYRTLSKGARADLLCMRRRLDEQPMLICEVKISRGDLAADLRAGKWRAYLAVAACTFACPATLSGILEVPQEAGLILRHATGWKWARQPRFDVAPAPSPYLYRRLALTAADQAAGSRGRTPFGDERRRTAGQLEATP